MDTEEYHTGGLIRPHDGAPARTLSTDEFVLNPAAAQRLRDQLEGGDQ